MRYTVQLKFRAPHDRTWEEEKQRNTEIAELVRHHAGRVCQVMDLGAALYVEGDEAVANTLREHPEVDLVIPHDTDDYPRFIDPWDAKIQYPEQHPAEATLDLLAATLRSHASGDFEKASSAREIIQRYFDTKARLGS